MLCFFLAQHSLLIGETFFKLHSTALEGSKHQTGFLKKKTNYLLIMILTLIDLMS